MAVLRFPIVLLLSDEKPTAVFHVPLVRLKRAFCPSAVLPPGYPPSGGGLTACVFWTSAKQPSRSNARNRTQFIDSVGVFMSESCETAPNIASEKLPNFSASRPLP